MEVNFEDIVKCADDEEREKLLESLVGSMTLKEKIAQMSGNSTIIDLAISGIRYGLKTFNTPRNRRLGIPPIKFTDGPRGICLGRSTCFPSAMARGATWDLALMEKVGSALGTEAKAQGANFFGGICINLLRHPGWGRAQETFGEDPFALGEMGSATIKGVQKHLMACVKHFACNSIERSRFSVDVVVDERTLREVYLPHFRRCLEAPPASVMSAYNKVNGTYCGHNSHLLREILKEDWGYEGLVMSDWLLGIRDGVLAVKGGLDVEMPMKWRLGRKFKKAVKRGDMPESLVDDAVKRVIKQKARFSGVGSPTGYNKDMVAGPKNVWLALQTAEKSMVMLKNEGKALPLKEEQIRKIAVIGKLADHANTGDLGSSRVRPPYVVTPLKGIRNRAGEKIEIIHAGRNDKEAAVRAASLADVSIVVAGLTYREEGEYISTVVKKIGGDRTTLNLPPEQEELIRAVGDASKRSVVVLECGSAVTMESWKNDVDAILVAWYPGMEGGNAVARILFGDVNPSGKLPVTFPESEEQLPFFDNQADSIEYGYYHGYRLFDKKKLEPAFPFGFGLSCTTYSYENLRLDKNKAGPQDRVTAEFEVTNTGNKAGEEVAQLYIDYENSQVERPVKELKGFARVALEPGEKRTVSISVDAAGLAYYDVHSGTWLAEEIEYSVMVGSSSRNEDLTLRESFEIVKK